MKKVLILLASYNGEKYIKEQIDSILNQKNVQIDILINDDCSSDNTQSIIKNYMCYNRNIHLNTKKCGSASKNFYTLINLASDKYDYYAFSDQDDYWKEDKIYSAISLLDKENDDIPLLYSGESTIVDSNLEPLKVKYYKHYLIDDVNKSLVACNTQGCTMVFNRKLLIIIKNKTTSCNIMHDAWLHRTCLILGGKIIFDNNSYMYYRQHENNVFACAGKKITLFNKLFKKICNTFGKKNYYILSTLIKEWESNFNDIINNDVKTTFKEIKDSNKSLSNKLKIIFSKKYHSKYKVDYIKFIYLIMIGKI